MRIYISQVYKHSQFCPWCVFIESDDIIEFHESYFL